VSYSRLSQGKIYLEPLDLHDLIKEVLQVLATELEQRKIEVVIAEPSVIVLGHRGTLIQVFANLE
jgi:signal transduction histidine kinase